MNYWTGLQIPTPFWLEELITYSVYYLVFCIFLVSCSCLHTVIQKIPRNRNVTLPFRLINVKCECVKTFPSAKPQILRWGTVGKAPNNRLLYVPEKLVDHNTAGLESTSSTSSVPSGKPQRDLSLLKSFLPCLSTQFLRTSNNKQHLELGLAILLPCSQHGEPYVFSVVTLSQIIFSPDILDDLLSLD